MNTKLTEFANNVVNYGPSRVVINSDGEAISSERALSRKIAVNVVFIRNDGWSLGAPKGLEATAFGTWPNEWIGFIECQVDPMPKPISEYRLG